MSLLAVCAHLTGRERLPRSTGQALRGAAAWPDLADVRGQPQARRALEIAAAGAHNLLLMGPPGTGKTLLAQRLPGILPPLEDDEALEAAAVQSLSSAGFDARRFGLPPWRAPHHTASAVALIGGGSPPRPGEVSLAHHGVLFLDELPEFHRHVLEVLREPLESGRVTLSRAARQADFPARFQLVAAMNPCPCGYHGHPRQACACSPQRLTRYRARLSGPFLDRIDLHVEVPVLPEEAWHPAAPSEATSVVRARVVAARERQRARQGFANAWLAPAEVDRRCAADGAAQALLRRAAARYALSARGYHRLQRVARTIADLAGEQAVSENHVAEALAFRPSTGAGPQ